jgi:hypothetical protein
MQDHMHLYSSPEFIQSHPLFDGCKIPVEFGARLLFLEAESTVELSVPWNVGICPQGQLTVSTILCRLLGRADQSASYSPSTEVGKHRQLFQMGDAGMFQDVHETDKTSRLLLGHYDETTLGQPVSACWR